MTTSGSPVSCTTTLRARIRSGMAAAPRKCSPITARPSSRMLAGRANGCSTTASSAYRARLLEVAEEVFAAKGVSASTEEIAKAAGSGLARHDRAVRAGAIAIILDGLRQAGRR